MPSPRLFCLALLAGLSAGAMAQPLDPADRDPQTPACTDFYQHANGGWLSRNPVPAGRGSYGRFDELRQRSQQQQRALLDALDPAAGGPVENMLAAMWRSGNDEASIEARGAQPLAPLLARIDGISRPRDVAGVVAELHAAGIPVGFNFGADVDLADRSRTIAYATQGGLGLPDPDYYLREDAETRALLGRYRAHIEQMLALTGVPAAEVQAQSGWIVGIEMRLAGASLRLVDLRHPHHAYKPQGLRELDRRYPNLQLRQFARAQGLRSLDSVSLAHERYFQALNGLLASLPAEQWQAYLRFHTADAMAPYLSQAFRNTHFQFHERLLGGRTAPPERWEQVLDTMTGAVGDAMGSLYALHHLADATRERAEEVVTGVRDALGERLEQATWLGTEARAAAHQKLQALSIGIGAPAAIEEVSGPSLDPADFAGNVLAVARWRQQQELGRIGNAGMGDWPVPAHVPDITYDLANNRLTVTAALLQPPVLSADGDTAVDYGALGSLAGQQLTHAFAAHGRAVDAGGQFNDWWTEADANGFEQRVSPLVAQYDRFNALDGIRVNGRQTRDENVADLGGVELAWHAFDAAGPGDPVDGLSAAQRFFLAQARIWQRNYRPEALRLRLSSEIQAPAKFRVNGPLAHQQAFADAFSCPTDSPMIRSGEDRVVLWQ